MNQQPDQTTSNATLEILTRIAVALERIATAVEPSDRQSDQRTLCDRLDNVVELLTEDAEDGALCRISAALSDINDRIGGNERVDQSIGDSLIEIADKLRN
jgi:hypothetical protein